ncbi:MAG: NADH-quinone oxidoreductase subunit G [Ancrocorticia sp.]|jgi:NADH-quinone oxidoreductase subunit G|nr:NADH-quinone oxidoreductase subunit G [Ancrocorticia sp.]MCI1932333.1 NADH-quinone oxidoreductase subunit G [Ancrocorticia sp.]MCI2177966.1 NADH-quinone oxidoreductase subunit G [Ancrocorticia sp.]MCI2192979.1 NADH-quinone oxidoreductase subunit G [Ancrocorticia sp.]MCI2198344.1 NADH-quinone oxidoreductase subunit G [Ancrocorticia sp.]
MSELVTLTIDGKEVSVPKGTMIIRAAEQVGVRIPRFCDHPLLKPAGACRQCLVEVARPGRDGKIAKMPKPVASCSEAVSSGMEVYTQHTSEVARKAQHGIMEFLLINHPMDCPICDKGGECPLQNQAMTEGRTTSRFIDVKRTYPKPVQISSQILLDRDRCILCQRCTRFQSQIAGDRFIQLQGRGGGNPGYKVGGLNGSQIGNFDATVLNFAGSDGQTEPVVHDQYSGPFGTPGLAEGYASGPVGPAEIDESGRPFASYFSGNIIQICPVGALTSASYRFRARPFDLVSVPSVAEHDASGSAIRIDYRRGEIVRRLAGEDPEVNEEWITDKDRFAFRWQEGAERLTSPLVRNESGELVTASWPEALERASQGLRAAKENGGVGVLPGGRLTLEDAYAYSKFTRVVLGTNDIDSRTRPCSAEEDAFLGSVVAGSGLGVTYQELEKAGHVLNVGFEAEEECGTVFLRLRKGFLAGTVSVSVISAYTTRGSAKMGARVIHAVPGSEASILDGLSSGDPTFDGLAAGGVILVGERTAEAPGALSAVLRLAQRTGARVAWVPRRAGDRGAVEAGAYPHLLPAGRPVAVADARVDAAAVWGAAELPELPGRNTEQILDAAASGKLSGLLIGGVSLDDLPQNARAALHAAPFVVQLEVRKTAATEFADVVLPVAPPSEKGGSFINWEGRIRPFGQVLVSHELPDRGVLNDLAAQMGTDLGLARLSDAVQEISEFQPWDGQRIAAPNMAASTRAASGIVLASWNLMLGAGDLQSGEPYLAGSAHKPVALLSSATAHRVGAETKARITGPSGYLDLDVVVIDMPDDVVWVPQNSHGCQISHIGARAGDTVSVSAVPQEVAK